MLILPDPSGAPPGRSVVRRTSPRGCAPLTPGYVLAVPPGIRVKEWSPLNEVSSLSPEGSKKVAPGETRGRTKAQAGLHSPEGTQAFSRQPGLAVPSTIDSESSEGAQAENASPTAPSTKTPPPTDGPQESLMVIHCARLGPGVFEPKIPGDARRPPCTSESFSPSRYSSTEIKGSVFKSVAIPLRSSSK